MASSDSTSTAFGVHNITAVRIEDGASNTITIQLFEAGGFQATIELPPYTEVLHHGAHASTPVLIETADSNVTGSIRAANTGMYSTSAAQLYEVLTGTGNGASWTSTSNGSRRTLRIEVDYTIPGGVSQTATFPYCTFSNIRPFEVVDGVHFIAADFVNHGNTPTVT